jgi:hypothetical protein
MLEEWSNRSHQQRLRRNQEEESRKYINWLLFSIEFWNGSQTKQLEDTSAQECKYHEKLSGTNGNNNNEQQKHQSFELDHMNLFLDDNEVTSYTHLTGMKRVREYDSVWLEAAKKLFHSDNYSDRRRRNLRQHERNLNWLKMLHTLAIYKLEHNGDTHVPQYYIQNQNFGNCCAEQREQMRDVLSGRSFRRGLSKDQVKWLSALEFWVGGDGSATNFTINPNISKVQRKSKFKHSIENEMAGKLLFTEGISPDDRSSTFTINSVKRVDKIQKPVDKQPTEEEAPGVLSAGAEKSMSKHNKRKCIYNLIALPLFNI